MDRTGTPAKARQSSLLNQFFNNQNQYFMKTENVIYQDKHQIEYLESLFKDGQKPLQTIADKFNALGIGNIENIEELNRLMEITPLARNFQQSISDFISAKIGSQVNDADLPKVGLFRMKKQNFVSMLEMPDATEFNTTFAENHQHAAAAASLSAMEKGKIVLDKNKHAEMIRKHTTQAETPGEKAVLKQLHVIIETLNSLMAAGVLMDHNIAKFRQAGILSNRSIELQVDPGFFNEIKPRINNK